MAEKSYNGWPASEKLKTRVIEPVKGVKLAVADNQNVADVFTYLVREYHERVDDITKPHPKDDWGYAYRPNRNDPSELSCHASGTAVDLDATEHPNGVLTAKTFSTAQINEIHLILSELDGVVRWGGDFNHTVDAMHFEICVPVGGLQAVGKKIRDQARIPVKTDRMIAREVINGKWGNGPTRKAQLTNAGYNYYKIQSLVQSILEDKSKVQAVKKK